MGAFGRLLIEYWGGDLALYDGHRTASKPVAPAPKVKSDEDLEDDKRLLERISEVSDDIIRKGESMLKQINASGMYHNFKTEKGMADFENWRLKFMKKLEE